MKLFRAVPLVVLASLSGCIPIWYTQYRLVSSDGTPARSSEASYSTLEYPAPKGAKLEIMVDADSRRSIGMVVLFHATVPATMKPGIVARELELSDCGPNAAGPLKIETVLENPPHDGEIFFQWYVTIPNAPGTCTFKAPTFTYGDQQWVAPSIRADRGTTPSRVLDLTRLPAH